MTNLRFFIILYLWLFYKSPSAFSLEEEQLMKIKVKPVRIKKINFPIVYEDDILVIYADKYGSVLVCNKYEGLGMQIKPDNNNDHYAGLSTRPKTKEEFFKHHQN